MIEVDLLTEGRTPQHTEEAKGVSPALPLGDWQSSEGLLPRSLMCISAQGGCSASWDANSCEFHHVTFIMEK